jgi:hypothetical protein
MAHGPVLRLAALLAAMALLLPLAAFEASCADCLWTAAPDGCSPSCCPCCVHGPALAGARLAEARLAEAGAAVRPAEARIPSPDPRAVFHVPKPSPA